MNRVQPVEDGWANILDKPKRNSWSVIWQTAQNAATFAKSFFVYPSPYETVRSCLSDRELIPVLKNPLYPLPETRERIYNILGIGNKIEPSKFFTDISEEMGNYPIAWGKTLDGENAIVAQYERNYEKFSLKVVSAFLANGGTQEEAIIPNQNHQYSLLVHDPKKSNQSRNMSNDQLLRDHHGINDAIESWNHR